MLMLQARYKNKDFQKSNGNLSFTWGSWEDLQLITESLTKSEKRELTESDWFVQYRLVPVIVAN